jgi:uncharacterized protein YdaT|tara:strand:- start:537 stop:761 length:225 start_codon:yes stop_codon:yes gene_type:complete
MSDQKYKIVDGEAIPVLPAKAKEIVKNKRTGKVYDSKAHFDSDVADTNTDTTEDDFQQDVEITVASLDVFGKND